MCTPIPPLYWSGTVDPSLRKTWISRFNGSQPAFVEARDSLRNQLLLRQRPDPSRWGTDASRIRIGQLICKIAQEEYEWPNDRFIPRDPIDLVFLMMWDDLALVEVGMRMEEELGLNVTNEELYALSGKTMGELVHLIASRFLA